MSHGLGRRHAPDPRDNNYPLRAVAPRKSTRSWRYWNDTRAFLDQGNQPHCVGYSWTHWLIDGPVTHKVSYGANQADEFYREAQKIDEWPGEDYAGSSVRAGAKVLQARGLVSEYRWAFTLNDVVLALLEVGPVVVGTDWHEAMFEPDEDGFIRPEGEVVGGHAYLLNGVSVGARKLRIKNSWGKSWGTSGRAFLDFQDFEELLATGEACLAMERKS